MARDKSEIQDRLIGKMSKDAKGNSERDTITKSLAEQIKDRDKYESMTPEQKLISLSDRDYHFQLHYFLDMNCRVPRRIIDIMNYKESKQFIEFRKEGTSFQRIMKWMEENASRYNR